MEAQEWNKDWEQDLPTMDDTHKEFVERIAQAQSACDDDLLALWQALVEHTVEHFAQEDRWMLASGFAAGNCHASQHQVVLAIMQEAVVQAQAGDVAMLRGLLPELVTWFDQHAYTMDAALAQHMRRVGLDVGSGAIAHSAALPAQLISGCGGACSS